MFLTEFYVLALYMQRLPRTEMCDGAYYCF